MLGGADNPNGELLSYIIGADSIAFLMIRATLSRYACPSALTCVRPRLWR